MFFILGISIGVVFRDEILHGIDKVIVFIKGLLRR